LRPESTLVGAIELERAAARRAEAFGGRHATAVRSTVPIEAIAAAGRLAVVALPVAGLTYHEGSRPAVGALALFLTVVVWWAALRAGYRATHVALGAPCAAAVGSLLGLLLVSALSLWLPPMRLPGGTLLQLTGLIFAFATGWEQMVHKRLARRQKVLILGTSDLARCLADEAKHCDRFPFTVVGVVGDGADVLEPVPPLLGSLAELAEVVDAQQPDLIVLADGNPGPAVDQLLETSWRMFRVVGVSHFFEHALGRVPLAHIGPAWFMSVLHLRQRPYSNWAKRTFDLVLAIAGLLLAAPVVSVVAIAVRLSGRPVLFRQTRLGEHGRTFEMYKFRTMVRGAEAPGSPRWAMEHDPRVTATGRILRRTRLDELPQLWNVLRGEMSIVGPRPERPEFVRVLEEQVPFWNRRLLVKPGLTGWAQVEAGYAADCDSTARKLSYDLWYVRHRTLLIDLAICAKTLRTLLSGAGAR
jgi:exopolysaccharide biosynthesis polyprenyl glycosylphosphotransferase